MSTETRPTRPFRHPGRPALVLLLPAVLCLALHPVSGQSEQPAAEGEEARPGEQPVAPVVADDPLAGDGLDERGYLALSLTTGAAWDSGFLVAGEELEDTVYVLSPSLLLHRPGRRAELTVAYEPELETFQRRSDLDAVHHAAGAVFQYDASRRSRLLAGGSLLEGEDPGRHLGLGGLLIALPRGPYEQYRLWAGAEHRWQQGSLLLQAARTETRIEPALGLLAPGLDQSEDTFTLTAGRTIGPRTDLTASYSYTDPRYTNVPADGAEPDEEAVVPLSDPVQTFLLGFGLRPGSRLTYHLSGGLLHERDELFYLAAAEVLRSGDGFSFRLRYDRSLLSLSPAAAGGGTAPQGPATGTALADTTTQALTFSFVARPTSRLRWEQLLWGATTSLPGDETLDSFAVTSRLVLETTHRLGLFAQADYFDQSGSALAGVPFSRQRYTLGLILGLAGPERAWGIRGTPAHLDRVLPYRRGGSLPDRRDG